MKASNRRNALRYSRQMGDIMKLAADTGGDADGDVGGKEWQCLRRPGLHHYNSKSSSSTWTLELPTHHITLTIRFFVISGLMVSIRCWNILPSSLPIIHAGIIFPLGWFCDLVWNVAVFGLSSFISSSNLWKSKRKSSFCLCWQCQELCQPANTPIHQT